MALTINPVEPAGPAGVQPQTYFENKPNPGIGIKEKRQNRKLAGVSQLLGLVGGLYKEDQANKRREQGINDDIIRQNPLWNSRRLLQDGNIPSPTGSDGSNGGGFFGDFFGDSKSKVTQGGPSLGAQPRASGGTPNIGRGTASYIGGYAGRQVFASTYKQKFDALSADNRIVSDPSLRAASFEAILQEIENDPSLTEAQRAGAGEAAILYSLSQEGDIAKQAQKYVREQSLNDVGEIATDWAEKGGGGLNWTELNQGKGPSSEADANVIFKNEWQRDGTDPGLVSLAGRMGRSAGKSDVTLNSGSRPARYNKSVGGADKSKHIGGNAIDYSTRQHNVEQKRNALKTALASGFIGAVGVGQNSIHVDSRALNKNGKLTIWGYPNGKAKTGIGYAPTWARDILEDHQNNGFTKANVAPNANGRTADRPMAFLELLGVKEGGKQGWNAISGETDSQYNLTSMTRDEVSALQAERRANNAGGTYMGMFQVGIEELKQFGDEAGVKGSDMFNQENQLKIAIAIMEKQGFSKWKSGDMATEDFIFELSKKWGAIPKDESGESYYSGQATQGRMSFTQLKQALEAGDGGPVTQQASDIEGFASTAYPQLPREAVRRKIGTSMLAKADEENSIEMLDRIPKSFLDGDEKLRISVTAMRDKIISENRAELSYQATVKTAQSQALVKDTMIKALEFGRLNPLESVPKELIDVLMKEDFGAYQKLVTVRENLGKLENPKAEVRFDLFLEKYERNLRISQVNKTTPPAFNWDSPAITTQVHMQKLLESSQTMDAVGTEFGNKDYGSWFEKNIKATLGGNSFGGYADGSTYVQDKLVYENYVIEMIGEAINENSGAKLLASNRIIIKREAWKLMMEERTLREQAQTSFGLSPEEIANQKAIQERMQKLIDK